MEEKNYQKQNNVAFHYLMSGSVSLSLWILSQFLSTERVFYFMNMAVDFMDSGYILAAAVTLVMINSARAVLLYIGWFLLGEGISRYIPGRSVPSWLFPLVAIPLSYFSLQFFSRMITPHFGIPAVLSVTSVLVLHFMTREVSGWFNKTLALGMFIFSFQWFDVTPFLTPYGAGWGELSMSVKGIAVLMEREMVLNVAGAALFTSFFLGGIIISELLVAYSSRINSLYLLRENENKLALMREESIRSRVAVEIQRLVHDLKRPLTTITGLTDVILSLEDQNKIKSHASVIGNAANTMNGMVSEILNAQARRRISVSELIDYTCNQISPFEWKDNVKIFAEKDVLEKELFVNLIRFSRALVNLIDNSHRATRDIENPFIGIYVLAEEDEISIRVRDNGPGFGPGFPGQDVSGWNSTGIGLGFVRQVVEENGGSMNLSDHPDGGGQIEIRLKSFKRNN